MFIIVGCETTVSNAIVPKVISHGSASWTRPLSRRLARVSDMRKEMEEVLYPKLDPKRTHHLDLLTTNQTQLRLLLPRSGIREFIGLSGQKTDLDSPVSYEQCSTLIQNLFNSYAIQN